MHKGMVRFLCCFIPSRKMRHAFRAKHIKNYYDINGENNVICFGNTQTIQQQPGIQITIIGNNNKIYLPDIEYCNNFYVFIRANNSEIHIGKPRKMLENLAVSICCGDNQHLDIGDNFTCYGCRIQLHEHNATVKIGKNCLFSNSISFWPTDGHSIIDCKTNKILNHISNSIEIGDHVWIGEGVKILKNVHIADNCVIGAASVVCKSFKKSNVVIAGNPAKIVHEGITWDHKNPSALEIKRKENQ